MSDAMDSKVTSMKSAEGESYEKSKSWEKFSHWVSCMCIVTFDLELGQAIEVTLAPLINVIRGGVCS